MVGRGIVAPFLYAFRQFISHCTLPPRAHTYSYRGSTMASNKWHNMFRRHWSTFTNSSQSPFSRFHRFLHTPLSQSLRSSPFARTFSSTSKESTGSKQSSSFRDFFKNFGKQYGIWLEEHPYKTQMATSGFLGFAGDFTTQYLEHGWAIEDGKKPKPWDMRRLASVTAFGIFGMGPMGHLWYEQLDRFTLRWCRKNWQMVATKVFGDTFVFGPVCLWLFFVSVSIMEGTPWEKISRKLWRDFVPTYIVDYSFWPLVQSINFHFVPVRHQLLVVNSMCYFDDIFLSYVQHNELPKLFLMVEDWWEEYYEKNLLKPGEKMEDIFNDFDDDD